MKIPVTVNRSIHTDALYKALVQSQHMKNRGYAILYSYDYGQGDYGLCYSHNSDSIFIHLRVLAVDPRNTFRYFIAMGEKKHKTQIDLDLKNLMKEIETNP